jgi:dethiobiotin synthetase
MATGRIVRSGAESAGTGKAKPPPLRLAVIGTDTGVGKSRVTALLTRGLRAHGRAVWLHKPVACGGWDAATATAEDGRSLDALCGDGQARTTICPRQFPAAASPHLAAAEVGVQVLATDLVASLAPLCRGPHDLLVEGAGGLATPLSGDRHHLGDVLRLVIEEAEAVGKTAHHQMLHAHRHPLRPVHAAVLVARAGLGTLNHSSLTAMMAHACGLGIIGVVVNHVDAEADPHSLALRTAAREIALCVGAPVLSELPWDPQGANLDAQALELAAAVLARSVIDPEPVAGMDV